MEHPAPDHLHHQAMTKFKPLPSQAELHRLFDYSVVTGALYRKVVANNRPQDLGKRAGGVENRRGYRLISINNVRFSEHRVIYKWVTGVDPQDRGVDHINGITDCNAWHNLRLANQSENISNSHNTRGYSWDKSRGKWIAKICKNYKEYHLGRFDTEAEARAAYEKASRDLHGEFSSIR